MKDRPATIAIIFVLIFIFIIAAAHKHGVKNSVTVHTVKNITGGK